MRIGLLQNKFQLLSFCILKSIKSSPNFIKIGLMQEHYLDRLDYQVKNILLNMYLAGLKDLITRYNHCYWYLFVYKKS